MNNYLDFPQPLIWEKKPLPQRIGLVLGGGVARGIAHIGVLEVLEQHGIRPDYIAGTSAGALVGGLYAAGISPSDLYAYAQSIKWRKVSSLPLSAFSWANVSAWNLPLGLLDLDKLIGWINEILGSELPFEQTQIPFAAVATDALTGETVVLNQGPIAPAIRASCSVPGIFTPVRRQGRLLIDGGASNNLPVSVVHQMGAGYVIAVDLLAWGDEAQIEPKNMLEVTITSLYCLIRATQSPHADCLIRPAIGNIGLADLAAADRLVQAGRVAAETAMEQIRQDLGEDAGGSK